MDLSPLTALILAGGLGTRLRPLVDPLPKALAPLAGRPFLEYQIGWLRQQGITRLVLCLGHRAMAIQAHFGDGRRYGVEIVYSVEAEPLGTAGALGLARAHVQATFLALNGDTYYMDPVASLLDQHRRRGALLTIGAATATAAAAGLLTLGDEGRVLDFAEQPQASGWVSAGLYVAEPALLAAIPPGRAYSFEQELLPALLAAGAPVYAQPLPGGFVDMGTPAGYARLAERLSGAG